MRVADAVYKRIPDPLLYYNPLDCLELGLTIDQIDDLVPGKIYLVENLQFGYFSISVILNQIIDDTDRCYCWFSNQGSIQKIVAFKDMNMPPKVIETFIYRSDAQGKVLDLIDVDNSFLDTQSLRIVCVAADSFNNIDFVFQGLRFDSLIENGLRFTFGAASEEPSWLVTGF